MTDRIPRQKILDLMVKEDMRLIERLTEGLPPRKEPTMEERNDKALAYLQSRKCTKTVWPTQLYNMIIRGGIISAAIIVTFAMTCTATGVWP